MQRIARVVLVQRKGVFELRVQKRRSPVVDVQAGEFSAPITAAWMALSQRAVGTRWAYLDARQVADDVRSQRGGRMYFIRIHGGLGCARPERPAEGASGSEQYAPALMANAVAGRPLPELRRLERAAG